MSNSFKIFNQFYKYIKKWHSTIFIATIYSTLNKLFDIAPEILIGIAVDLVVEQQNSFISKLGFATFNSQLIFLAICIFLIWGSESLFQYLYMIKWRYLSQNVEHEIRLEAYSHVQKLDYSWYENQKLGNVVSILNDDVNQLERFLDNGANEIIQIIISSIAIGAVFFYISPIIACVSLLPIPIILFVSFLFQKGLSPRYRAVREAIGKMNSSIFNNLIGILTIKSFTSEQQEIERIKLLSKDYQLKNQYAIKLSSAFVPVIRFAILSGFLSAMIIGAYLTKNGTIQIGSFTVIVFLTQRFLWPFTRLGETIDLFERSMASTNRILNLLQTKYEIRNKVDAITLKSFDKNITFNKVSFHYKNGIPILNNLSFKIKKNQFIGIVGQTGSGKTTLIKLLLRFYEPQNGTILIGDHNINNIEIENIRKNIGIVHQDTFLFDGTIKENIIYPSKKCNEKKLINIAKLSQCYNFITNFDKGYNTLIGERGQKLSGGQKQRLAIARALYKNPDILIFDEATSAVDNETELFINKSLTLISKERTTIVIAHRLSTIRNADAIILLNDGKIESTGTHEQLMEQSELYQKLWNIQVGII